MAYMNSEAYLTNAANNIVHDIFEPAGYDINPATKAELIYFVCARERI